MATWENDELGRKESAVFLTDYLEKRYQSSLTNQILDSFVLAVNAEWGFGKSYLLQNWQEDLKSHKFVVVHFDAWKNDFSQEPLIGFISEIETSLKEQLKQSSKAQNLIDNVFDGAKKFIRPAFKTVVEVGAKKLLSVGLDELTEQWEGARAEESEFKEEDIEDLVVKFLDKFADEALKEHRKIKDSIELFKKGLEKLVAQISKMESKRLPIFILIDELDRCRPTYSIELLENIKHLFGVRGVYFVIATNLDQLAQSIKVVYGPDFDSSRYLKRFFDQEYQLPIPDNYRFADYLLSKNNLQDDKRFFTLIDLRAYPDKLPTVQLFALLSSYFKLSLRDQEQIITALNAIVLLWKYAQLHLWYLLFLLMLRSRSNVLFEKYRAGIPLDVIKKEITQLADLNVNIAYIQQNSRHAEASVMDVLNIFSTYHNLRQRDLKDISQENFDIYSYPEGKIKSKLRDEFPSSYYPDRKYASSLTYYCELVSQAGHLSS